MSFFYTQDQIRIQTKTVTRRLGWDFLKPGEIVNAVEKAQGLKGGEKIVKICQIRIKSIRPERLDTVTDYEVELEGFPDLNAYGFISMFCKHMKCKPYDIVNRIEFEYL